MLDRLRSLLGLPKADYRRFLLKQLPKRSIGCEIGVWKGDFSAEILAVVDVVELYLIDPWSFQPEFPQSWYGGLIATSQKDMDEICQSVHDRFAGRPGVHIIRKKTEELTDEIPNDHLDWVYIDGNHSYQHVLTDLKTFHAKVKSTGVLCGDDYDRGPDGGSPITAAVTDFVDRHPWKLASVERHQFVLRRA